MCLCSTSSKNDIPEEWIIIDVTYRKTTDQAFILNLVHLFLIFGFMRFGSSFPTIYKLVINRKWIGF